MQWVTAMIRWIGKKKELNVTKKLRDSKIRKVLHFISLPNYTFKWEKWKKLPFVSKKI